MTHPASLTTVPTQSDMMTRHGITEVPVAYFHYGDFRYTSLRDALAQAERDTNRGVSRAPR